MADKAIKFRYDPDRTLRLFPDERYDLSLSTWGANAKAANQRSAPDKGLYDAIIDDTYRYWVVFDGEDQPIDWSSWVYWIDTESLEDAVSLLQDIKSKTDLLGTGQAMLAGTVTPTGELAGDLIIGDDYLTANGRDFRWTIDAVPGFVVGETTFHFGGLPVGGGPGWSVTGSVEDIGGGQWECVAQLPSAATVNLRECRYRWSAAVRHNNVEITQVRSGYDRYVYLRKKQT